MSDVYEKADIFCFGGNRPVRITHHRRKAISPVTLPAMAATDAGRCLFVFGGAFQNPVNILSRSLIDHFGQICPQPCINMNINAVGKANGWRQRLLMIHIVKAVDLSLVLFHQDLPVMNLCGYQGFPYPYRSIFRKSRQNSRLPSSMWRRRVNGKHACLRPHPFQETKVPVCSRLCQYPEES